MTDATSPTPMERLEKWRDGDVVRDYVLGTNRNHSLEKTYSAGLWAGTLRVAWATGPTLDAAILAALAQAGERTT